MSAQAPIVDGPHLVLSAWPFDRSWRIETVVLDPGSHQGKVVPLTMDETPVGIVIVEQTVAGLWGTLTISEERAVRVYDPDSFMLSPAYSVKTWERAEGEENWLARDVTLVSVNLLPKPARAAQP